MSFLLMSQEEPVLLSVPDVPTDAEIAEVRIHFLRPIVPSYLPLCPLFGIQSLVKVDY